MTLRTLTQPHTIHLVVLFSVALLLRLLLSFGYEGTGDTGAFCRAGSLALKGYKVYEVSDMHFSGPPLAMHVTTFMHALAEATNLPCRGMWKLPTVIADMGIIFLIYHLTKKHFKKTKNEALLLASTYAFNPISLLINGFHGQQEAFWMFLMLSAIILAMRKKPSLLAVSACAALAIGYKLPAILLLPTTLSQLKNIKQKIIVSFGVGVLILFTLLPEILTQTNALIQQSFLYTSTQNVWGITLIATKLRGIYEMSEAQIISLNQIVKIFLVTGIGLISIHTAIYRRAFVGATLIMLVFFLVFAPGFGVQYLVWPLPFMLLYDKKIAAIYSIITTFALLHFYGLNIQIIDGVINFLQQQIYYVNNFLYPYDLAIPVWIYLIYILYALIKSEGWKAVRQDKITTTNKKSIAIIGAGITGLSAANRLSKLGHRVVVFEQSDTPGGLGTYLKIGNTHLERYYHHFFQSDKALIALINELNISQKLMFYRVKTGIFKNNRIYPFSSPKDLLSYNQIAILDRIRIGIVMAILKILPQGHPWLDRHSAVSFIKTWMGTHAYKSIWKPLLKGKFSNYSTKIPAQWLWGRVHDRTFKLGYLNGSVKVLFDALIINIENLGGTTKLRTAVSEIKETKEGVVIKTKGSKTNLIFDTCLITTTSPIANKLITSKLTSTTRKKISSPDQLGAICVILELKHKVQSQYWLNICEDDADVLVMIEQTNLIDKKRYGNKHIVYLANYIHRESKHFHQSDKDIIRKYSQFLKTINPNFKMSWVSKAHISRVPRAQTIFTLNAEKKKPPYRLSKKRIYLANIDQMYPHDRNLNWGVVLGKEMASMIDSDLATK